MFSKIKETIKQWLPIRRVPSYSLGKTRGKLVIEQEKDIIDNHKSLCGKEIQKSCFNDKKDNQKKQYSLQKLQKMQKVNKKEIKVEQKPISKPLLHLRVVQQSNVEDKEKSNNKDHLNGEDYEDMIFDFQEMERSFKQIQKEQDKLKQNLKILAIKKKQVELQKSSENQSLQSEYSQQIEAGYRRDILNLQESKYKGQLSQYPHISLQDYALVTNIWNERRKDKQIITSQGNTNIQLTYHDYRTLSYGSWLNDEVITNYIMLMNQKLNNISLYRILNSVFAASIFKIGKTIDQVSKSLKKQKIQKHNIIVIAVNYANHWFFVTINDSRIQIFDSLKKSQESYLKIPTIQALILFTEWFYGFRFRLQVIEQFPQQSNHYDCGIMMIFGIKDVVRQKNQWSFSQRDCKFKRIQMAKELLKGSITGF